MLLACALFFYLSCHNNVFTQCHVCLLPDFSESAETDWTDDLAATSIFSLNPDFLSVDHFQLQNWYWIYVTQKRNAQSHISKGIVLHNRAAPDLCLNPSQLHSNDSWFWHGGCVLTMCIPPRAVNRSTVSLKACTESLSSTELQEQLAPSAEQECTSMSKCVRGMCFLWRRRCCSYHPTTSALLLWLWR